MAALLWRNASFRIWLAGHLNALYITTGVFLAGFITLGARYPASGALPMQTIGYTWIAILYGLVMVSAMTSSAGPIAVVARTYWLREIGRVSYCLYLIHDAMRFGAALLIRSIIVLPPSWELGLEVASRRSSPTSLRGCHGRILSIRSCAVDIRSNIEEIVSA